MNARTETFAFLPPMTPTQIGAQAETMLANGQIPIVEYIENPDYENIFWKTWPMPEKKEMSSAWVVAQLEACARRNPYSQVRLSGYCPKTHRTLMSFIVRAPMEQG